MTRPRQRGPVQESAGLEVGEKTMNDQEVLKAGCKSGDAGYDHQFPIHQASRAISSARFRRAGCSRWLRK